MELSAAARPAAGIPGAAAFLDQLARCLVPACDPAVVAAVLARASAGYTTARGRDGRRASAITPSGVPFEASVTGGDGRLDPALRYTTEAGTGLPFFGPRLAAQRAALDDLVAFLPAPALAAAGELAAFAAVLFPDPGAVPARTRFATTVGVVHTAAVPAGVAGLKLYGNLTAEPDALGRLAAADDRIAALAAVVEGLPFLAPAFATREVDAAGRVGHKLYLRTATATGAALSLLARRCGGDAGALLADLDAGGVDVARARDKGPLALHRVRFGPGRRRRPRAVDPPDGEGTRPGPQADGCAGPRARVGATTARPPASTRSTPRPPWRAAGGARPWSASGSRPAAASGR